MRKSFLWLGILFLGPFSAAAQDDTAKAGLGPSVTVELRCLRLPAEAALPLVRAFSSMLGDREKARTTLDEAIAKGTAKIVGWPILTTHSGQKASIENYEEMRYASEYDPGLAELRIQREEDQKLLVEAAKVRGVQSSVTPTAFETRNVGVSLEIEPYVDEDLKGIRLDFVAQHVALKSIDRITLEREMTTEKRSEKTTVEQPRFVTLKVTTSMSLKPGESELVGSFASPEVKGEWELFILTAEVRPAKK